ncbi:MAG: DUF362 domain-containing protein [Gemmatimonadota bacterium]|nr:DUF362 domain-containing protein [Gemmatimonadota bacterium]
MPKMTKRKLANLALLLLIGALIAWDIYAHQAQTFFVGTAGSVHQAQEPLQVEGLPLLRPGTLTLGEGHPTVAVATSSDSELAEPAALNTSLNFAQVDAIVRRALDLDQSERSIRAVIEPSDWVVVKVNIVTNRGNPSSAYYHNGIEHPGQITDLRVVKSVINYLIEQVGPRRITIAEGGAESPRKGEPGFPTNAEEDGWSATYPEFGDLSYIKMLEKFAAMGVSTVVDTSDLNYAPFRREPVPGGPIQRLGVTRLRYPGAQFGFHVEGTGSFRKEGYFMPEPIIDADKVISIAAMKTTIYGTTLGIKNYVGTLASGAYGDGTSKRQHYQNNPEHGYVDLFSYNPAAYTVIEGFWGTEGDGPQWGQNVQHNVVVAGGDPLATEAMANVVMGFNPLDLEHLYLAATKGFGTFDLNRIQVEGRAPASAQRNFVKSRGGSRQGAFYGRGIRRWLVAGPFPNSSDIGFEPLPNEAQLYPRKDEPAGDVVWTQVEHLGYTAEVLPLGDLNGKDQDIANYAFTLVHTPQAQEGFLWLGYGDYAKVWLNGDVVYENVARRNFQLADQKVPIRLVQGENRLLFKIGNSAGNTVLAAHVVDQDGDRLPGIEFLLPGEIPTAVEESTASQPLPESPVLLENYPNPFNPSTRIRFALPQAGPAKLDIYNAAGQWICTLVEGDVTSGYHEVMWDARNASGFNVASGTYFAVLKAGDLRKARPMTLVR